MCLLASEESLSCAANTTFGPQKTADILNYPQRQRATQKRNNAYLDLLEEKKDPRSTPFVIARNLSAASVIASIANVSVRFGSKQRGTRVKDLVKKNGASKRAGRGDQQKSGPLWPLWGCERTRRTHPPYGPGPGAHQKLILLEQK